MTARLVALYKTPADVESFDKAYFETHLPLAQKMPGLRDVNIQRFEKNIMGKDMPYHLMAELTFDSVEAVQAALASNEGKAAGANLMGFAAPYMQLFISDTVDTAAPVS